MQPPRKATPGKPPLYRTWNKVCWIAFGGAAFTKRIDAGALCYPMVHWMNWIGSHRTKKSTNRWSSPPHLPRNADKNDCDGHEPNTISVATKNISNLFRIFKDIQNLGPTLKCKVHCPCPKSSTHFVLALQMSTKHALHIHVRIHEIVEYITTCAARFASGNGTEKVVALDGTV